MKSHSQLCNREGESLPVILYLTERFIMSQSMGYNSAQCRDSKIVQLLSCQFPRQSIVFLVSALFGNGADIEIAVAPVFVVLETTTRWIKDKESYLIYPKLPTNNVDCSYSATWHPYKKGERACGHSLSHQNQVGVTGVGDLCSYSGTGPLTSAGPQKWIHCYHSQDYNYGVVFFKGVNRKKSSQKQS